MNKILTFLMLLTPFLLAAQHSHSHKGSVAKKVIEAKITHGNFETHQLFSSNTKSAKENYSDAISDGLVFDLNAELVANLKTSKPEALSLEIPFDENGSTIQLDLIQKNLHAPGFILRTSDGRDLTSTLDLGIHYTGMIAGDQNSVVSISIFDNEVIGLISNATSNYTLGKLRDSRTAHVLYDDKNIYEAYDLNCAQEDDGVQYRDEMLEYNRAKAPGDCVNIYVEAGQTVYNSFGSDLTATTNFLNGVFAQSFVLYANEGITMQISEMFIWTTADPYTGPSSANYRSQFQANTGAFNGDLGHLVEVDNVGGIAAGFSGICNVDTDQSLCFSGFSGNSFNNVPTYSFNVFIISHEMGHLMGSRHTHACVWNGNATAIDGCSGFTEGGCALPPDASPGTIMSYCTPDISFTEGFHPQPQAVMLNTVNNATCLSQCGVMNNDECAGATMISCGDVVMGSTLGMGVDSEVFCGTSDGSGGGVWYEFTGTGDNVTISTCGAGTDYDTKLRVFTGSCDALVCEGGDDDDLSCGFSASSSTVSFTSNLGTAYYILVHGFGINEGNFELSVVCPMAIPNDNCDDALPIDCNSFVTGTTVGATVDTAPFCGTSDGTGGGVWYTFTGDGSCVTLSTCNDVTDYDSRLRVYEGSCAALTCVAGDDDDPACTSGTLLSTVDFVSVPGTTYYVLVHGFGSAEGVFQLDLTCSDPEPLVVDCPLNVNLACGSTIPAPITTTAEFTAQGGVISGGGCPGATITYSISVTGQMSGDACNGIEMTREYTVTSDVTGESSSCIQTLSVAAPSGPTITCPADITVTCEDEIDLDPNDATVTTDCGLGFTSYIKQPLATGAPGCNGTVYTYIYKVVDDCGRVAQCSQNVLIQNTPASITAPAGGLVSCFEDIEIGPGDASVTGGCAEYDLYFIPAVLDGPANCPGSTYTYTYRLVDYCGNVVEEEVVFTIDNNSSAPVITSIIPTQTTTCLAGVNPSEDFITFDVSCGEEGTVNITGPQILGPMDCLGTIYRYNYTVTDGCGRTSIPVSLDYRVENEGPKFLECEEDTWLQFNCEDYGGEAGTIAAIEAYIASVEAYSACDDQLTVFNNFNSNNINTCINNGINTITFRATDNCGRTSFCTTTYVVVDTEAPTIFEQAQDHWEICNFNSPDNFDDWVDNNGGAEAFDGCSTDNVFWSTIPANPSFSCAGAIGISSTTVTFVARDNCGNSTSTTATFNAFATPGLDDANDAGLAIENNDSDSAKGLTLYQNKPNPFKNETSISFNLPEAGLATLTVYNINGQVVKQVKGEYAQGFNEVNFNRSDLGETGVLYYTLRTLNETATKIMVVID